MRGRHTSGKHKSVSVTLCCAPLSPLYALTTTLDACSTPTKGEHATYVGSALPTTWLSADVTKSGGYLIEQSVHNLDACNWVIGAHPMRACGFGGILMYKNDPPGRTIFDCGSLTYEYPNGVKMSFTQNVFHFDLSQFSFGVFGFLLVTMMVLRPEGLLPERRRKLEFSDPDHVDESVYEAAA